MNADFLQHGKSPSLALSRQLFGGGDNDEEYEPSPPIPEANVKPIPKIENPSTNRKLPTAENKETKAIPRSKQPHPKANEPVKQNSKKVSPPVDDEYDSSEDLTYGTFGPRGGSSLRLSQTHTEPESKPSSDDDHKVSKSGSSHSPKFVSTGTQTSPSSVTLIQDNHQANIDHSPVVPIHQQHPPHPSDLKHQVSNTSDYADVESDEDGMFWGRSTGGSSLRLSSSLTDISDKKDSKPATVDTKMLDRNSEDNVFHKVSAPKPEYEFKPQQARKKKVNTLRTTVIKRGASGKRFTRLVKKANPTENDDNEGYQVSLSYDGITTVHKDSNESSNSDSDLQHQISDEHLQVPVQKPVVGALTALPSYLSADGCNDDETDDAEEKLSKFGSLILSERMAR